MISEDRLRQAVRDAGALLDQSLPDPDQCHHTFSPAFLNRMEALLRRRKRAPVYRVPVSYTHLAAPYVGYAYEKGLTNGKSETRFDPDSTIRASEYLTFVLRALGYVSGTDFAWDSAWTLSDKLGITHGEYNASTTSFDLSLIHISPAQWPFGFPGVGNPTG